MNEKKTDQDDQNSTRMITPYLTNSKIDKLDRHVKLGDARSRSDMVRICIDFWLDTHPLPEEIDVMRMQQARAKQAVPFSKQEETFDKLTIDLQKAAGADANYLPAEFFQKISRFLVNSYKIEL